MNTDSRRKASSDYHTKRKAEGWRKVTVWLDPESAFKVDALKAAAGSADEVHRQAIKAWAGPAPRVSEAEIEAMVAPKFTAPTRPEIVVDPKPKPRPKRAAPAAAPSGLQFGATRAKPGALLKGGKG